MPFPDPEVPPSARASATTPPDAAAIAAAADHCLRPWRHGAVVVEEASWPEEITLRLECRDGGGVRFPQRDLELELYRSGSELNLVLSWSERPEAPMLWQGQHPVWMDPMSGQRSQDPGEESNELEALGRRLRSLLAS